MPRLPVICLLALLASVANAGPAGVPVPFEPVQVGQGTLRYLGLRIYDATLWAPPAGWHVNGPYALELTYARRIAGARLAASTVEEIHRQYPLSATQRQAWEQRLQAVFPDVEPGDRLAAIRIPGQGIAFHASGRSLGRIEDEWFADAFFGIWLGTDTRKPDLRARLLGG
ncbi:MAG: chalcone isomerase family protein [Gammaproteobacteria bacterium]|nr:chalcone isomerase family protein [Gammaproteobacteria bacterium]